MMYVAFSTASTTTPCTHHIHTPCTHTMYTHHTTHTHTHTHTQVFIHTHNESKLQVLVILPLHLHSLSLSVPTIKLTWYLFMMSTHSAMRVGLTVEWKSTLGGTQPLYRVRSLWMFMKSSILRSMQEGQQKWKCLQS